MAYIIFNMQDICILIKTSLKSIHEGPIDNRQTVAQDIAWTNEESDHYASPGLNELGSMH